VSLGAQGFAKCGAKPFESGKPLLFQGEKVTEIFMAAAAINIRADYRSGFPT
jgi:hypothetical protein